MICILAFILLLIFFPILGFFPQYRSLYRKAWSCVWKKMTLRPCDMNFGEEIKSRLLSKLIFRFPTLTKFLKKTFSFWAFAFLIFTLWTVYASFSAGLNLLVYDTCNPETAESCSLSGSACGVNSYQPKGILEEWIMEPVTQLTKTISLLPNRFRTWNAEDYLSSTASFSAPFNAKKPTALEIIDPGCRYCRELFGKIKETAFEQRYNLSYLVYPIPNKTDPSGYKFRASKRIAQVLEAVKKVPPSNVTVLSDSQDIPADWQFLEAVFAHQVEFNHDLEEINIAKKIKELLSKIGYSENQIAQIQNLSDTLEIQKNLEDQRLIVEEKIYTIRIPTIIFGKKRFDRVPSEEQLRE